jgi:hypothetical protein
VITQGRKEVLLSARPFVYEESRYLLTSIDLLIVSQIPEATESKPFIGLALKLELSTIRDLLNLAEFPLSDSAADSPAMATGGTTVEILDACRRSVDLVGKPDEIPVLSRLTQREIIFRILQGAEGARLRAIATLGNQSIAPQEQSSGSERTTQNRCGSNSWLR